MGLDNQQIFLLLILTSRDKLNLSYRFPPRSNMGEAFSRLAGYPLRLISKFVNTIVGVILSQVGNDYLIGMVVWGGIGHFAEYLKSTIEYIRAYIFSKIFTSIRLGEQETKELMEYLKNHPDIPNSSMLTLCTSSDLESDVSGSRVYSYEPELNTSIRFYHKSLKYPGYGSWVWVADYTYAQSSTQEEPMVSTTITIFGRDKYAVEEIIDIGRDLLAQKRKKFLQIITVYNYKKDDYGLGWNHGYDTDKKQPGRSIQSVILPEATKVPGKINGKCSNFTGKEIDQAEALLEDAREFLESERWYTERGIPYRRGYLLHGIPGGGKSSLVSAVASELKLPIYILQLSNELLTDDALARLFQTMTLNPSIVLLEDIDAASELVGARDSHSVKKEPFEGGSKNDAVNPVEDTIEEDEKDKYPNLAAGEERKSDQNINSTDRTNIMMLQLMQQQQEATKKKMEDERKRDRKWTLSGLLNALDGPSATTGRLLFMTTNHRNKLDPALIRSGRIDYEIEFRPVTSAQVERLFQRFYVSFREDEIDPKKHDPTIQSYAHKFAQVLEGSGLDNLSAADIQGHLMKYKSNPSAAVENLHGQLIGPRQSKNAKANQR